MSALQFASTSTSSEVCSTPTGGANAFPRRSGWTSSSVDNERSAKRQNSTDRSGTAFKRQRTPPSSVTTNNEHVSTNGRRSSGTEVNRAEEEGMGMNENDIVHQRNLAAQQDGSPAESEVKVALHIL